jgi:hypothetical protein
MSLHDSDQLLNTAWVNNFQAYTQNFSLGGWEGVGGETDPETVHNLCFILKTIL